MYVRGGLTRGHATQSVTTQLNHQHIIPNGPTSSPPGTPSTAEQAAFTQTCHRGASCELTLERNGVASSIGMVHSLAFSLQGFLSLSLLPSLLPKPKPCSLLAQYLFALDLVRSGDAERSIGSVTGRKPLVLTRAEPIRNSSLTASAQSRDLCHQQVDGCVARRGLHFFWLCPLPDPAVTQKRCLQCGMQIKRAHKTPRICEEAASVRDEPRGHEETTPWHPVLHLHVELDGLRPAMLTMVR